MGKPNIRLNPQIESRVEKILLEKATKLILFIAMLFPEKNQEKRGVKPYDYRKILALCVLRIFLKKTYADYEIETRTDVRICKIFGLIILPSKSTIQRGMNFFNMELLREFNSVLLKNLLKRKLNILIDSSGIRIIGRSVWYCIRIKKEILRRECDKVHIAICSDLLLILNWRITSYKKNDSPFLKILVAPFRFLGLVIADKGYSSRENHQFVVDKKGAAFIPFKDNATGKSKSHPAWKLAFNLWKKLRDFCEGIYHQRSRIECVFSALKKRFGDNLKCKTASIRRKEMSLRFIAYNVKIVICYLYSVDNNMNLWVRAN